MFVRGGAKRRYDARQPTTNVPLTGGTAVTVTAAAAVSTGSAAVTGTAVTSTVAAGTVTARRLLTGTATVATTAAGAVATGTEILARYARHFDGAGDVIRLAADGHNGLEPTVFIALWSTPRAYTAWNEMRIMGLAPDTGGNGGRALNSYSATGDTGYAGWIDAGQGIWSPVGFIPSGGTWRLTVASRGTTDNNARLHNYEFTTSAWSHNTADGTGVTKSAADTAAWVLGADNYTGAGSALEGRIVAAASGAYHPTNLEVETLVHSSGAYASRASWENISWVQHVWQLTQSSIGTSVPDTKGNADQLSVAGTSVYDAGSNIIPWVA